MEIYLAVYLSFIFVIIHFYLYSQIVLNIYPCRKFFKSHLNNKKFKL